MCVLHVMQKLLLRRYEQQAVRVEVFAIQSRRQADMTRVLERLLEHAATVFGVIVESGMTWHRRWFAQDSKAQFGVLFW